MAASTPAMEPEAAGYKKVTLWGAPNAAELPLFLHCLNEQGRQWDASPAVLQVLPQASSEEETQFL